MKVTIRSTDGHKTTFESLGATYFGDEGDLMIIIPKGNIALQVGLQLLFKHAIKIENESRIDRDFIFVKPDVKIAVDIGEELEE